MQESCNSKYVITLPPNVRGKPRGFIEIEITNIKWKKNGPASRFENLDIVAKLVWWGQNKLLTKKIIFNKTKTFESIAKYKILTNCKLFYNYLLNCEPIKILLFTKTSNYNLGIVKAKIPIKIVKGCNNFLTGDSIACTEFQKYQIYSEKGEILGEITIKFKMLFYDPISERENIISNTFIKPDIPDFDKEIEVITSSRSYRDFKDQTKCKAEKETYSSRIVNYLSGRKMSKRDEEQALKEIQRISPLGDKLLDNLRINIPKSPETVVKNITQSNRINSYHCEPIYNKIDSLYINVKYLKLLPPAIREVNVKSLIKTSFTVECKISPNLLDSDLKRRLNYDVMRFYSNTFDDIDQRIDFNKDAIRSIKLICNGMDGFSMEHSEILFTIWWREYGSRYSRCLGTTKCRFTSLFNRIEKEHEVKLKVRSCPAGVHVADLHCKINLGSDINYIGTEFYGIEKPVKHCHKIDQYDEDQWPICCNQTEWYNNKTKETPNNENYKTNDQKENYNTVEDKQTAKSSAYLSADSVNTTNPNQIDKKGQDESNIETAEKENSETFTLLKGLLYVGEMKNVNNIDNSNYFCVARAFWKEDPSSSGFSHDNNFNFMEIFSIISDTKFLERVRNNILIVELWQKSKETHEKLFGVVRLPLHQFFIAFRDPLLANHLCKAKLPVISIDGLTPIVSPLSGIMCGRLQALLCIGTEEQINNLKHARGFNLDCVFDNNVHISNVTRIPIPQFPEVPSNNLLNEITTQTQPENYLMVDVESQTNFQVGDCANSPFEGGNRNNKEKLSNILGNFLDNLTQTIPSSSSSNPITLDNNLPEVEKQQNDQQNTLRRTSDLLDMLQKALMQPTNSTASVPETIVASSSTPTTFKLFLEIECALHLPRNPIKMISKKNNKRSKGKQIRFPPNEEPSAYVTFQAEEGYGQMFKSHEGMVYATNVIEKCSNPSWGKRFEICLSTDYLIKDNYPFMIRVWRKAATDLAHCRLLPTPIEDSIIGVSAVDLTVLMARMPVISGWYNIIDFSGKVNGQIKLNIKPMEDVLKFKIIQQVPKLNSTKVSFLNSRQTSNNINLEIDDLSLGIGMDMSLSRAFKRKLVELEEINQRLRARLLDVTGEADPDIDLSEVDDEQMDEFERDLNTECTEDEDGESKKKTEQNDSFLWLHDKEFHKGDGDKQNVEQWRTKQNVNDSDDSNNPSNQEKIKIISEFLQKTEISNEDNDINKK